VLPCIIRVSEVIKMYDSRLIILQVLLQKRKKDIKKISRSVYKR